MCAIKRDNLALTSVTESPCGADGWRGLQQGICCSGLTPVGAAPLSHGQWLQQPGDDLKQLQSG